MAYKPDQGRIARTAAFWSLALLIVYGCTSLNESLGTFFPDPMGVAFGAVKDASGRHMGGATVPILSWKLTPALVAALLVCAGALFALYTYLNRPKTAELLIETEHELRKVTWPTMNEAMNSSVVVIVCVVFLMTFLAGADWLLGQWVTWLLLGGG
ncbi:MAG: preprotein translocase subunit SecE [Planctomycetes bacterium]|nr:preprotein translocase subunit SecE [Planctomycetota bacterium]